MNSVPQNVVKHKVGLLNLATELGNVSRACKVMGFSRDTFYWYQSAMQAGGVEALLDTNRKMNLPGFHVQQEDGSFLLAENGNERRQSTQTPIHAGIQTGIRASGPVGGDRRGGAPPRPALCHAGQLEAAACVFR